MTPSPPPCRTEERRTLISSTSAQHRGSRHRIHDTRGFSKAFLWGRDVLSEDRALNTTSSGSSSFSTPGNGYGIDVCSDSGRAKREGEAVMSHRTDQVTSTHARPTWPAPAISPRLLDSRQPSY